MEHRHMKIWISAALVLSATFVLTATPVVAQNASSKSKSVRQPVRRPVGTVPADISPEAAEVVWLYHHNSTTDGLLHYINNSHADFKLSVEDVNYLKDIGISTDVVFAMVRSPQARERVLALRDREPMHRVTNHAKQQEPQTAFQNIDFRQNQPMEANPENSAAPKSENNVAPKNSGPSDNVPAQPVPQAPPYGAPGYNGIRPGYPGYPGYNGYRGDRLYNGYGPYRR
jgi:hypothetical protein